MDCLWYSAPGRFAGSADRIARHLALDTAWTEAAPARRDPLLKDLLNNAFHPRRDGLRGKGLALLPVFGGSHEWRE